MNITEADVHKLKQELEDDLRALKRVEQIFQKRQPQHLPAGASSAIAHHEPAASQAHAKAVSKSGAAWQKGALRNAVIDALKAAGPEGSRPKAIVSLLEEAGYPFRSHHVASSIVGSALARLCKRDKLVEKTPSAEYVWRGTATTPH